MNGYAFSNGHRQRRWISMSIVSSTISSVSGILFKFVTFNVDFLTTLAYEYLGVGLGTGMFFVYLFLTKRLHREKGRMSLYISFIFLIDKLIEIGGQAILAFAVTIAPIALVSIIGDTQSFIVFYMGLVLSIWFPHIIKEDLSKKTILTKICSLIFIFVGIMFIS